jgi:PII-like signaling protein
MTSFTGEKTLMRIHISENDKYGHKPLFEALIELFMHEKFAGATVLKGVSGFGVHAVYHTYKLLELSNELPIIVEVIAARERIDNVMPRINEMMSGGLITLEKVEVVRYCTNDDLQCAMKEP